MTVHNHGPEDGPGLGCRERLIGECLIAAAVCRSEIAGSGHATGDIPCEWHGPDSVKVKRFIAALREGER